MSPFFDVPVFRTHVNTEQNFTIEAQAALEAGETTRQGEVCQDVILGGVQTVQRLVTQAALVQLPQHLQLVVGIERLDTLLLYQDLHWK